VSARRCSSSRRCGIPLGPGRVAGASGGLRARRSRCGHAALGLRRDALREIHVSGAGQPSGPLAGIRCRIISLHVCIPGWQIEFIYRYGPLLVIGPLVFAGVVTADGRRGPYERSDRQIPIASSVWTLTITAGVGRLRRR
jgi:hypothetical protein